MYGRFLLSQELVQVMHEDFIDRVLPVVRRFARRFQNPDLRSDVETLTWLNYQGSDNPTQVAAECFAWYAIRRVCSERYDYIGRKDAMSHAWLCGLMGNAACHRTRRPEETAAIREAIECLKAAATPTQRAMIEVLEQEMLGTKEIAARLNISQGRISQIRRELLALMRELRD